MEFIPDTIILDTSELVKELDKKLQQIDIYEFELCGFLDDIISALTDREVAYSQLMNCVTMLKDRFMDEFNDNELDIIFTSLVEFGVALLLHLDRARVYIPDNHKLPYEYREIMKGGDIMLRFSVTALWNPEDRAAFRRLKLTHHD